MKTATPKLYPIFVYGTLVDIRLRECPVFTQIRGMAIDLGGFPALISVGAGDDQQLPFISGELRWVGEEERAAYDRYETKMYRREKVTTICGTEAEVYVWNNNFGTGGVWKGLK